MKKDKKITLIIREENVVLLNEEIKGNNVYKAIVEGSLYLGPFLRTIVRLDKNLLGAYHKVEDFERMPKRGDSIYIELKKEHLLSLEGEIK